jgi:OFA family oxalate/formate antiporter-like MFS transporter
LVQQKVAQGMASEVSWSLSEALRNKTLWLICAQEFCTVLPIQIEKSIASWAWGLVGGISILGRIITPISVEGTIGWRKGLIVVTAILAASFIWISKTASLRMLLVFVVIYGFCYGGKVSLNPALVRSYFGTKSLGQLIGFIHAISLIGGAIGPLLAGYVVDITGNYVIAFSVGAGFLALATFLGWLSRAPKRIKEDSNL